MAYNETLAARVRELISEKENNIEEKKMFSGLCFMVNDKMCIGIHPDKIMVRFDPALNDELMEKEGVKPMDFTNRVMKGFAFVDADVLNSKKKLSFWIDLALDYNKIVKAAKKKKKAT